MGAHGLPWLISPRHQSSGCATALVGDDGEIEHADALVSAYGHMLFWLLSRRPECQAWVLCTTAPVWVWFHKPFRANVISLLKQLQWVFEAWISHSPAGFKTMLLFRSVFFVFLISSLTLISSSMDSPVPGFLLLKSPLFLSSVSAISPFGTRAVIAILSLTIAANSAALQGAGT